MTASRSSHRVSGQCIATGRALKSSSPAATNGRWPCTLGKVYRMGQSGRYAFSVSEVLVASLDPVKMASYPRDKQMKENGLLGDAS